jgi:hypothetical protein
MTTTVNGIADRLQAVARGLDRLPPDLARYIAPTAGTYNCRDIAKTHRLSVHGYGAAIDFNVRRSDYWQWAKPAASYLIDPNFVRDRRGLRAPWIYLGRQMVSLRHHAF